MKKSKRSILSSFKKSSRAFKEKHGGKLAVETRILNGLNILLEKVENPENKGKMSKAMIIRRDRCARNRKVRAYVQIQNPDDKNLDNAVHRYCTYLEFRNKKSRSNKAAKRRAEKSAKRKQEGQ